MPLSSVRWTGPTSEEQVEDGLPGRNGPRQRKGLPLLKVLVRLRVVVSPLVPLCAPPPVLLFPTCFVSTSCPSPSLYNHFSCIPSSSHPPLLLNDPRLLPTPPVSFSLPSQVPASCVRPSYNQKPLFVSWPLAPHLRKSGKAVRGESRTEEEPLRSRCEGESKERRESDKVETSMYNESRESMPEWM